VKELAWFVFAYLLQALESPLLGHLDSQFFAPDIALLTAVYAGSRTNLLRGLACAFAVGLIKDGLSMSAPLGLYTEINVLALLMSRVLARRVDFQSTVPVMATAAGMSLGATGLFLMLEAVFHRSFEAYGDVLRMALPLSLITMLVAPVHFAVLDRLTRRFESRDRGVIFLRR
jgi:rod shape-determining protein MreD